VEKLNKGEFLMVNAVFVKQKALGIGADICNIAPVERFEHAPKGFHPADIFPDCSSVVVFLTHFPLSSLKAESLAPYTFIRNMMVKKIDNITLNLCDELEQAGVTAIPVPCDEPYEYWDEERQHGRGVLSLKHAAVLAGLGTMGKNTLLINNNFGNMIWLGAVLVSAEIEPDPKAKYEGCIPECTLCIDSCAVDALDGNTINQKLCRNNSFAFSKGGGMVYTCNQCRIICPNHAGI
jgi:epoxyqueuosine reductase